GIGLGPALAPDLLAGRHRWQVPRLLRLRTVLEHGGREEEDAVLADAFRRADAVVLLIHEPLEDADVPSAVLDGPADHGPSIVIHGALPGPVGLEAFRRIEGREGNGRDVGLQPGPGFGPERLVLGAEGQVHGAANLAQGPAPCQGGRAACPPPPPRVSRLGTRSLTSPGPCGRRGSRRRT